jgi:hypothetical protein
MLRLMPACPLFVAKEVTTIILYPKMLQSESLFGYRVLQKAILNPNLPGFFERRKSEAVRDIVVIMAPKPMDNLSSRQVEKG